MKKALIRSVLALLAAVVLTLVLHTQVRSEAPEAANFAGVQFRPLPNGWSFFDTRTGDIWIYDQERQLPLSHYRLRALGAQIELVPNSREAIKAATKAVP